MGDEKRNRLREKNLNKINPHAKTIKKYFPNGGVRNTEGRKKGSKSNVRVTKMSRNAITWALEGHSTKIRLALDSFFKRNNRHYY
jgi:hypothetical protein